MAAEGIVKCYARQGPRRGRRRGRAPKARVVERRRREDRGAEGAEGEWGVGIIV